VVGAARPLHDTARYMTLETIATLSDDATVSLPAMASSRLFGALALARGDGRYARLMRQFARVDLLILDDWGPEPLTAEQRRDLLEIVEDRYNCGSLIITSQVPVDRWYEIVGDPTLADAILDRLVHNSHRIALTGKSRRKPEEAE
jgi:DNA replication protein DnaC